ncbi:Putative RING zinc finger domain superfamily protein [Zea mays]|uniref:Putative RING zinc finger domain superfamily protein n=1 Tax=Zea mays TaxID=4577 RepID=A0A1D6QLJ6_MAIZE|nr:Putative RING zinc finger domain superfamily protein [Zea mays]
MDAGECSTSKPPQPSAASPSSPTVWARLVPADSACPTVEVAEDDSVVCSLVAPPCGGEEVAWCEIRRNAGDASSATIRNLSSDAIIVDGRIVEQECVDIKPGSEIVSGPQKEGHLIYTFEITEAEDHEKKNVKAILQAFSSLQRSDEEIALLESYASVKSNMVLGQQKNQSRKRRFSRSSDDTDNSDLPCPQCRNEFGGFRCSPGSVHLQCSGCGGMMPARSNISIPQKCLGCDKAFCGAYWYSQGVSSSHCNLICNQDTLKSIYQRHISALPDTIHGGNPYEKDITERCIQQSGKTLQVVISEWISKFDNMEIDRSRLQLNNVDAITSRTYICNHCYSKFVDFLLYWFRVSLPQNLLPRDAAERESCWYGFMCRTQHHRPDHAKKLNHVCRPTRGNQP